MTKSDLIDRIARRSALPGPAAKLVVDSLIEAITAQLASGGRVEIRGFGVFATRLRPPRTGRNPATGESVAVPAKRAPFFRASKVLSIEIPPRPRYKLDDLLAKCDPAAPPPADLELLTAPAVGRELR